MRDTITSQGHSGALEGKLKKYTVCTAAGLAAGAAAFESADAALVTTSWGLSVTSTTPQTIDIDSDGDNDLRFIVPTNSILQVYPMGNADNAVMATANVGIIGNRQGATFYPTGFQASAADAGSSQTFDPVPGNGSASNNFGTMAFNHADVPNAQWDTTSDAYMGVAVRNAGTNLLHYGWLHATWDQATSTATIVASGFDDVAGAATHIPEPSGLALLALGATGLMQRRKRK